MTANAVIAGCYADLKTIRSRKVVQMIVEMPIEQGEKIVEMFGFPQPGNERWVAVAALARNPNEPAPPEPRERNYERSLRGREDYDQKTEPEKAVTRCVLMCKDPEFQEWLGVDTEEAATKEMRRRLKVRSRSEIGASNDVYETFVAIEKKFKRERAS